MTSHILVCPFNENLLQLIKGRSLVLRANQVEEISSVVQYIKSGQIHIHCLWVHTAVPLASIAFQQDWLDIPLALYVPGPGCLRDLIRQLPLLRQLNIRVYLPTDLEENYTGLRILSSLGIESSLVFKKPGLNWELLSDLMTYALLGLIPHAPIEPFNYIASHYDRHRRTDYSAVYFEDPSRYLHLDEEGYIALSPKDLAVGNFIGHITELGDLDQCAAYNKRLEGWRDFFLETDGCAYCQGWRVCLGKFVDVRQSNPGCQQFFTELMDVVEQHQSLRNGNRVIWQP